MSKLKPHFLLCFLGFSLSGCITSCEDIVPRQAVLSPNEIIKPLRTHDDNFMDDLIAGGDDKKLISALSIASDSGDRLETIVPNLIARANKINPDDSSKPENVKLLSAYLEALGLTGSDLAIPILSKYVVYKGFYENLEGLSKDDLKGLDGQTDEADRTMLIRKTAAISLAKIAVGKNAYHKGSPFGIPELIKALQDHTLTVRSHAVESLRLITNQRFNFEPIRDYDTRAFEQTRWKKWWTLNENNSREAWLISGFKVGAKKEIANLVNYESVDPLVSIVAEKGEHLNLNAIDALIHMPKPKEAEVLKGINDALFASLESATKEHVKHVLILAIQNLNKPIQVVRKVDEVPTLFNFYYVGDLLKTKVIEDDDGNKSVEYSKTEEELVPMIEFLQEWKNLEDNPDQKIPLNPEPEVTSVEEDEKEKDQ